MMLSLVNKYGLSHVCADPEFENIEYFGDEKGGDREIPINFPYLDMHVKPEFYRESPEIGTGIVGDADRLADLTGWRLCQTSQ